MYWPVYNKYHILGAWNKENVAFGRLEWEWGGVDEINMPLTFCVKGTKYDSEEHRLTAFGDGRTFRFFSLM